jgi:hypothetical protein
MLEERKRTCVIIKESKLYVTKPYRKYYDGPVNKLGM